MSAFLRSVRHRRCTRPMTARTCAWTCPGTTSRRANRPVTATAEPRCSTRLGGSSQSPREVCPTIRSVWIDRRSGRASRRSPPCSNRRPPRPVTRSWRRRRRAPRTRSRRCPTRARATPRMWRARPKTIPLRSPRRNVTKDASRASAAKPRRQLEAATSRSLSFTFLPCFSSSAALTAASRSFSRTIPRAR
jgi:hypothetical protein